MNFNVTKPRVLRWSRFILGGGINTAFTYGIYAALNIFMNYQLAYLLAYASGVVFSYWFNAVWVFRVPLSWKGFLAYPIVYIVQYASSAILLSFLVELFNWNEYFAPLLVTICMIPLTYIMSRLVLGRSSKSPRNIKQHVDYK